MFSFLMAAGAAETNGGWVTKSPLNSPFTLQPSPRTPETSVTLPQPVASATSGFAAMGSSLQVSGDVAELAAALEHDPVKICEFVRNNIEYDLQYGWMRTPERTLLDGMGTDVDQAVLLVQLLQASGYTTAQYVQGWLAYPQDGNDGYNLESWLGTSSIYESGWLLDRAGYSVYGYSTNSIEFYRYWVVCDIGGTVYELDPVFARHAEYPNSNIAALSGYSRLSLLASAGGVTGGNNVSQLNENALRDYLAGLSSNMIETVRSDYPNASVMDVLGGRSIIPESGLCTNRALHTSQPEAFTALPVELDHGFFFSYRDSQGQDAYKYYGTLSLGSGEFSIVMDSPGTNGTMYLDGVPVFSGDLSPYGQMRIYIVQPYAYYSGGIQHDAYYYDRVYNLNEGSTNAFVYALGASDHGGIVRRHSEALREFISSGDQFNSRLSSMHSMGDLWMNQHALVGEIANRVSGDGHSEMDYAMGQFASDPTGDFVDIKHLSDTTLASDANAIQRIKTSKAMLASALEHGVMEQTQPGLRDAVSTVDVLTLASRDGQTIYWATSNNFDSVKTNLVHYYAPELSQIQEFIDAGNTVILHEDGNTGLNSWEGFAFIASGDEEHYVIAGNLYGGHSTTYDPFDLDAYYKLLTAQLLDPANILHPLSLEPVDMVTGAYTFDHDDLSLDGPLPLRLSRHYNTGSRSYDNGMGFGWRHSFQMSAVRHTDYADMLGGRTPEDAADLAVALYVIQDLAVDEDTAKGWMTSVLTAKWAMDQLTSHAVTLSLGNKSLTFIEQPDGSYTPPPGMTVSLSVTNDVYVMQERNASTYTFNANNLIAQIADPDGNTLTFTYNAQTNLQTVASSFGPTLTFGYTGDLLTSVSDNSSPIRTVQYQYDSKNNLTNFVDAAGKKWSVAYSDTNLPHCITALTDPEGIVTIRNFYNSIAQVTNQISATSNTWNFYFTGTRNVEEDPYGNQTAYYIDEQGRTWSIENALSNRTYTFYDGQNHVTNTVNENGVTNLFIYDIDHNLLKQREAAGTPDERTTGYGYDSLNRLRFVTNAMTTAEQTVTEYTYTATHHIDTVTEAKGKAEERVTDLDYYGNGLLHVRTDPLCTTTFVYDSRGNPYTVASTDAGTVNYDHNEAGWLAQVTDQNSVITKYGYNAVGLLTNNIHAYGTSVQASESRTYYDNRLLKTVTDAKNKTAQYFWTPAYKPAGVVFPDTGSITNVYDAADRLTNTRDAEQNWTQFQLDALGRVTNTIGEITTVSAQYDPSGQITNTVVDPSGLNLWRETSYDVLNRPLNQQSSIANQQFQYDSLSRMTNRVDPASKSWKTQYDALGQVRKIYRPSGSFEEYGYDAQGRRTLFYNAERKPMRFGYDAQGRVKAITNAIGRVTRFTYGNNGNLTDRQDAKNETTHYDYNALNRLTNVVHQGQWKASFAYDGNGNIVTQASPLALSSFYYDSMNRLSTSLISVNSRSFAVTNSYDLNGNRTNIVYPGGLAVGYSYDAENRLSGVTTKYTNSTKTFAFGYDGASRLTSMSYPNGINSTFGYDAESRVTNYVYGTFLNHVITRDPRGFKTQEDIYSGLVPTFTNSLHQTRTHNDADQLTVATSSLTNQVNYSYDPNGCLTNLQSAIGNQQFVWAYDSRLVSVSGGSSSTSTVYLYDASGARVGRIANGVTNYFVLDYRAPLKMPLAEADALGRITRYYVWSSHGLLAHFDMNPTNGAVVATRYYHADEQGSTLALTDASGAVTDQFAYSPYGELLNRTGTNNTSFQWLGGYGVYYDATANLHLTLHRAYSAEQKRFISADPLGIDGGANLYAYGDLNPLAFVDPLGLAVLLEAHPVVPSMTFLVPGPYGIPQMVTTPSVNHSKITIIPDNQAAYQNNKYFKRNVLPDGRVYTTLGAGPENGAGPFFADLVSNAGRDTDVNRDQNVFSTPVTLPQGMTEDQYIQHLFSTDANYQDNTTYELFPNNWSDDYNSNSYASGLLNATGGTVSQTPPNAPGYGKPLPSQSFGPHISK